jgi:beta-glucosidase
MKTFLLFLILFAFNKTQAQDTDKSLLKRAKGIVKNLSVKEKIAQTCQLTLDALLKTNDQGQVITPIVLDEKKLVQLIEQDKIGSLLNVSAYTLDLKTWRTILEQIHSIYLSKRVKIPIIYGVDAIHGANYIVGGTLFPQEIGLSATWNPELARKMGMITAYETRASGVPWNFSPVLDLGRKALWSRYFETLGEDPHLASEMGAALVKGYQGSALNSPYSVLSCMKHFVGYSYPNSGRDRTPAWIPDRQMKELFLPSFKAAVAAGALSVMINSGSVNGIPGHMNKNLLTNILKGEFGFKGFAVSDWEDIRMLHTVHKIAENQKEAIVLAINAGLDMSMVPYYGNYREYLDLFHEAVVEGKISKTRLDDAITRIIYAKLKLGLFETPMYPLDQYPDFGSKEFQATAKQAALESITLLKNDKQTLPLKKDEKILLLGAVADNLIFQNGSWTHTWQGVDSSFNTQNALNIKQAFQNKIAPSLLKYEKGYELTLVNNWENCALGDFSKVIEEAKLCDKIVVCLGEMPATEKPGDIRSLNLCEAQLKLVEELQTLGKPIVLVFLFGRPRIIRTIEPLASAIVNAYLPGDYGSSALVDLLYGEENFSGKLPYTFPKYDGVMEHYDYVNAETLSGKTNKNDAIDPQWPFGFGMSYTSYSYSNLTLSKTSMVGENDSIIAKITVSNNGKIAGKEVVQWFITDEYASISPANKKLKYFEKIDLLPNQTKTIEFVIHPSNLKFVGENNEWILEKGNFIISIENFKNNFRLD